MQREEFREISLPLIESNSFFSHFWCIKGNERQENFLELVREAFPSWEKELTKSSEKQNSLLYTLTSWSLLVESLFTFLNFLPNLLMELALRISFSVVRRIGTVPSGHDSPESVHIWEVSATVLMESCPFGLSGGSCKNMKKRKWKINTLLNEPFLAYNARIPATGHLSVSR